MQQHPSQVFLGEPRRLDLCWVTELKNLGVLREKTKVFGLAVSESEVIAPITNLRMDTKTQRLWVETSDEKKAYFIPCEIIPADALLFLTNALESGAKVTLFRVPDHIEVEPPKELQEGQSA